MSCRLCSGLLRVLPVRFMKLFLVVRRAFNATWGLQGHHEAETCRL